MTELLDLQKTALDYQYQMIFKTIMNESSFAPELKIKQAEQELINSKRR
jgi:transposase